VFRLRFPDQRVPKGKPDATLKLSEIFDDSIVIELQKEGFVERIYKQYPRGLVHG
jgi:hypothetical protein